MMFIEHPYGLLFDSQEADATLQEADATLHIMAGSFFLIVMFAIIVFLLRILLFRTVFLPALVHPELLVAPEATFQCRSQVARVNGLPRLCLGLGASENEALRRLNLVAKRLRALCVETVHVADMRFVVERCPHPRHHALIPPFDSRLGAEPCLLHPLGKGKLQNCVILRFLDQQS